MYILESLEDFEAMLISQEAKISLTPIEGLDGCHIMDDGSGFYVNIVNEKGEKLVEINFRGVENSLNEYDTLVVYYADDEQFAPWAKAAIYAVSGIKSGDTYQTDTGSTGFLPLGTYIRKQSL